MIEAGLTQSRRAAKVGIESDPAVLRAFVSSCESISYDHDSARSGEIGDDQETWLQTTVTGPGTLTFDYKLSCDAGDEYAFSIDGQYRSGRAGSKDWTQSGPWTISGAGTHTIRWKFIKDSSGSSGSDCLWIDRIRWTGAMPDGEGWDRIEYAYDAAGRRTEKKVDGTPQVKYVYDGDHIIAEYNNAGTLLRKYVHGPGVDQPICLIESSGTYAGTHYYHYDALGSCVAMTNSAGNVTQLYEYSVYGQVAASDADHPNRFMFTGREFDKDTGLYYYRARYYHPEIGRFLQTDPIGYGDGMNWYRYCGNSPLGRSDPYGLYADSNDSNDSNDFNDFNNGIPLDSDGDGLPDWEDPDRDGDGIPNEADEQPDTPGPLYMYSSGGDNPYTWYEYAPGIDAVHVSEAPPTSAAAAAVQWGNSKVGDTSYSFEGTGGTIGRGWKCNVFVRDAYVVGAQVRYPTRAWYKNSPPRANELADPSKKFRGLEVVSGGALKVGDIVSFPNPGGIGHTSIYIGNGMIVQAGRDGVVVTQIRNRAGYENMVVRRYTP
jgi:RHS repeat-associated protein